jgi:hypothetical protein
VLVNNKGAAPLTSAQWAFTDGGKSKPRGSVVDDDEVTDRTGLSGDSAHGSYTLQVKNWNISFF